MSVVILLVVNLAALAVMGVDKWRARERRTRVPELQLYLLALIGGGVGAWVGMSLFRHKTRKLSFQWRLALASVAGIAGWIAWFTVGSGR